jgi:hypothetical protein
MKRLTVVIPATDRRPTLQRAVDAVERALEGPEQLVIVDHPPNLSPAPARNLGGLQAIGDILVFVDADVEDALRCARSDPKGV